MASQLNHDRIFSLSDLNVYPGKKYLDRIIQLYWSEDPRRRIWLSTPEDTPKIKVANSTLQPKLTGDGKPRWIDYGVASMPNMQEPYPLWDGFVQVRFEGLSISACGESYLVITTKLDLDLSGYSLEEVQRELWGLAQVDAGSTTIHPSRIAVGKAAKFMVNYTAGPNGLPAGALVRFAVPKVFASPQLGGVQKTFSLPQTDRSDEAGFTSILQADCEVEIVEIRNMIETHEKTSIICRLGSELKSGGGFSLQYFTDRTFIYPTLLHEVEMRTWYSNLPPLTASVAISEENPFVNLLPENGHIFELMPGPAERLHLFLPGRRYASESLSLKATYTDHFRNVPPSGVIEVDIDLWLVTGGERTPLDSPAEHFAERHRFEIPLPQLSPGVYRVIATNNRTGVEVARSNPMEIIPDGSGDRLYWGEIHCHTEMSDGSGDFANVYRHARYEGNLEFASVTDHAEYFSDNQWEWMQDVTNVWNEPGKFVALIGYEWIGKQKDRIVYTARSRLDLLRGDHSETENLDNVWGHFHGDEEIVGGPHATIVHQTLWQQHDPEVERFAEIYSMWGACDFRDNPLVAPWVSSDRGITINDILKQGAKLGFTAGGDCHDGRVGFTSEDPKGQGSTPHTFAKIILFRCGMTGANMIELTRRHLIGALRNRRTYATTGARILLDFYASELPMGATGQASEVRCTASIHAVSPLERVEIIKDGDVVWSKEVDGLDAEVSWQDPRPPTREHYYYLHIFQKDGQQAWGSPVWISPK